MSKVRPGSRVSGHGGVRTLTTALRLPRVVCLVVVGALVGCDQQSPTNPNPIPRPTFLTIECGPGACQMEVGAERTFLVFAVEGYGSRRPEQAVWTTDDAAVAVVDEMGRVRAIHSGATTIRATAGTLSAAMSVLVRPRSIGAWRGAWSIESCKVSGSFDLRSWCTGAYNPGSGFFFELSLAEENGELSGWIQIDSSGEDLTIDAGGSLDADGRLSLSARGEGSLGPPLLAVLKPFHAQLRGTDLEGSFVLTVTGVPDSGLSGSVIVEGRLIGVSRH